jgi:hypothetical protein
MVSFMDSPRSQPEIILQSSVENASPNYHRRRKRRASKFLQQTDGSLMVR